MSELETKIVELIEHLEAFEPTATAAALQAITVDGYKIIIVLGIWLAASLGVLGFSYWLFRKGKAAGDGEGWYITAGMAGAMAALGTVSFITALANPWIWIAITSPELVLARDVLKRLI